MNAFIRTEIVTKNPPATVEEALQRFNFITNNEEKAQSLFSFFEERIAEGDDLATAYKKTVDEHSTREIEDWANKPKEQDEQRSE